MTSAGQATRRAYRSPTRQAQARRTRRRVLEAATVMFLRQGYAGATMRSIGAAAGVSVPTVEQLFGTKAAVLKAAIDVAIAGDDEPVPVLDRYWTARALEAPDAEGYLAVVASIVAAAQARSAGLVLAAFEGARTEPELAALAERLTVQRQGTVEWLVDTLMAKASLRAEHGRADAVDAVWILMDPAVYERLVRHRHWTPERYEAWFAHSVQHLLVPDASPNRDTDQEST
jgi:AcrR family transcriptional regulator